MNGPCECCGSWAGTDLYPTEDDDVVLLCAPCAEMLTTAQAPEELDR